MEWLQQAGGTHTSTRGQKASPEPKPQDVPLPPKLLNSAPEMGRITSHGIEQSAERHKSEMLPNAHFGTWQQRGTAEQSRIGLDPWQEMHMGPRGYCVAPSGQPAGNLRSTCAVASNSSSSTSTAEQDPTLRELAALRAENAALRERIAADATESKEVGDVDPQTLWCCDIDSGEDDILTENLSKAEETTTLMMCNIPFEVSVQQIIEMIKDHGFDGNHNFVYMPSGRGRTVGEDGEVDRPKLNQGYAFIEFVEPEAATRFLDIFQDFLFPNCDSEKLVCTKLAHVQGYNGNTAPNRKHRKHRRRKKHALGDAHAEAPQQPST